jgi:hypothetical protein
MNPDLVNTFAKIHRKIHKPLKSPMQPCSCTASTYDIGDCLRTYYLTLTVHTNHK